MPNCTTVVQTANAFLNLKIYQFDQKITLLFVNSTKNTHKILRHCPVNENMFEKLCELFINAAADMEIKKDNLYLMEMRILCSLKNELG